MALVVAEGEGAEVAEVVSGGLLGAAKAGAGSVAPAVVEFELGRLSRAPRILMTATLHQQRQQADPMKGQHKDNGDLDADAGLVFLLQEGALWNQRTLVVHFERGGRAPVVG